MSEPILMLMLGIGLLVAAAIAKKTIKTSDTPPGYSEETRKGYNGDPSIHPDFGGYRH